MDTINRRLFIGGEVWKPVVGFSGRYEVSNIGRIKSIGRKVVHGNRPGFRRIGGRFLKPSMHRGYFRVALYRFGIPRYFFVHRLVLAAFCEKARKGETQCNHKNGVKIDNSLGNLEWASPSENIIHAFANGLKKGVPHHMKKVIRSDGVEYDSIRSAARDIKMPHQGIMNVLRGKRKTCKGFGWSYAH